MSSSFSSSSRLAHMPRTRSDRARAAIITPLLLLMGAAILAVDSTAAAAVNVVATTEDLASLTREIGGDRVNVEAIARGNQDPHFVEPKPSYILSL
jgi:ABC-type Zn uptake system ZnuABC Zn-binding protein ZnuA